MIPVYANGMNININEVAVIEFRINTQSANAPVSSVAVHYEFLKQMYEAIGNTIEQHDKKLGEVKSTKANMN